MERGFSRLTLTVWFIQSSLFLSVIMASTSRANKALTMRKIDGKPGEVWYPYVPFTMLELSAGFLRGYGGFSSAGSSVCWINWKSDPANKLQFWSVCRLQIQTVPTPTPKPGELLLRPTHVALVSHPRTSQDPEIPQPNTLFKPYALREPQANLLSILP